MKTDGCRCKTTGTALGFFFTLFDVFAVQCCSQIGSQHIYSLTLLLINLVDMCKSVVNIRIYISFMRCHTISSAAKVNKPKENFLSL